MIRNIIKSYIIKRFSHTNSKTKINNNIKSKNIKDLFIEQQNKLDDINNNLNKLYENTNIITGIIVWLGIVFAIKRI